jgi:hypothetical protein
VEDEEIVERAAGSRRRLERSARRLVGRIDLGVAFIRDQEEVVPARELERALPIVEARDGALRVRRRAQIEQGGSLEQRWVERVEIGQEARLLGGREEDGLCSRKHRCPDIDLVEWVRYQRDWRRPVWAPRDRDRRRHVEAFARARARRDHRLRVDHRVGEGIAAREPSGAGRPKLDRALDARIAVPCVAAPIDDLGDEGGRLAARLADGEVDRCEIGARRLIADERGEPLERVVAQSLETAVEHPLLPFSEPDHSWR